MNCRMCGRPIRSRAQVFGTREWQNLDTGPSQDAQTCNHCKAAASFEALCKRYGITAAYYWEMFDRQDGRCAICRKPPEKPSRLRIDHCHATGHVRGLLCSGCNVAIGILGDTARTMKWAIEYLERFEQRHARGSGDQKAGL